MRRLEPVLFLKLGHHCTHGLDKFRSVEGFLVGLELAQPSVGAGSTSQVTLGLCRTGYHDGITRKLSFQQWQVIRICVGACNDNTAHRLLVHTLLSTESYQELAMTVFISQINVVELIMVLG